MVKYTKKHCNMLKTKLKDDERTVKLERNGLKIKEKNIKQSKKWIKSHCKS